MNIPEGYQAVMPYLLITGVAGFIDFTKKVFGAEEVRRSMQPDGQTVAHAEIQISGCCIMMGEASEAWKSLTTSLFVYVGSADETYEKALAEGAESIMGLSDQPYGRACGVRDAFGNVWWITSVQ